MENRRDTRREPSPAMQLDSVFRAFADLLHRRFAAGAYTTEDSARYTFFAALIGAGVLPEQTILEYAHPTIPGARVDTVILDGDLPIVAIEFKYDRAIPSGRSLPLTQKDGAVFADLVRLLAWPGAMDRYLIYLADKPPGASSTLATVFGSAPGQSHYLDARSFAARPPTFHGAMGTWPTPALLTTIVSETMPRGHHLRVYRVEAQGT